MKTTKTFNTFVCALLVSAAFTMRTEAKGAPPAQPVKVSGAVAEKLEKQRSGAPCGMMLNAMHATASARVEFTVLSDGSVTDLKKISDTGPVAYVNYGTLNQWTYNPYLVDGKPTAMRVTMLFECSPGLKVTYQ